MTPTTADSPSARPIGRLAAVSYGLAALVIGLDQLSKYWILEIFRLPAKGTVEILPVFSLSMVWNRGVSFGLLQAEGLVRWGLAAFSLVVAIALALWARKVRRPLLSVALGLV